MSTAARKARKRAGVQFYKEPKVPTPLGQRTYAVAAAERAMDRAMGRTAMKATTRWYQMVGLSRRNEGPKRRLIRGHNEIKGEV